MNTWVQIEVDNFSPSSSHITAAKISSGKKSVFTIVVLHPIRDCLSHFLIFDCRFFKKYTCVCIYIYLKFAFASLSRTWIWDRIPHIIHDSPWREVCGTKNVRHTPSPLPSIMMPPPCPPLCIPWLPRVQGVGPNSHYSVNKSFDQLKFAQILILVYQH